MAEYFDFVDRTVEVVFFEEDPITVTLTVSDDSDKKMTEYAERVKAAQTYEDRKAALGDLIGKDALEQILTRAPIQDSYALIQVEEHIAEKYLDAKAKNLRPAKAGREK